MRSDKALGTDGLLPRFMKEISEQLVEPLYLQFTKSMDSAEQMYLQFIRKEIKVKLKIIVLSV